MDDSDATVVNEWQQYQQVNVSDLLERVNICDMSHVE